MQKEKIKKVSYYISIVVIMFSVYGMIRAVSDVIRIIGG